MVSITKEIPPEASETDPAKMTAEQFLNFIKDKNSDDLARMLLEEKLKLSKEQREVIVARIPALMQAEQTQKMMADAQRAMEEQARSLQTNLVNQTQLAQNITAPAQAENQTQPVLSAENARVENGLAAAPKDQAVLAAGNSAA